MAEPMARPARGMPAIGGIISDLDGVVYRGTEPIAEAVRAFARWHDEGLPYCFVTNNSTRTPAEVADKLVGMGVACTPRQVVTSATATGAMLARRWPAGGRAYVLGAPSLAAAVTEAGFALSETEADCVVVGLDRELSYARLATAVRLVLGGAVLIGTNPDRLIPTETGFEPGAGSVLAAVALAAGVEPLIIGKPQPQLIADALERLAIRAEDAIMIGDQVATDIVAAQRAGVFAVLVQTGVPEQADSATPDLVVPDLDALSALIAGD